MHQIFLSVSYQTRHSCEYSLEVDHHQYQSLSILLRLIATSIKTTFSIVLYIFSCLHTIVKSWRDYNNYYKMTRGSKRKLQAVVVLTTQRTGSVFTTGTSTGGPQARPSCVIVEFFYPVVSIVCSKVAGASAQQGRESREKTVSTTRNVLSKGGRRMQMTSWIQGRLTWLNFQKCESHFKSSLFI